MWAKNALLLGIATATGVAFAASVFPSSTAPAHWRAISKSEIAPTSDFQAALLRVDASFRGQWKESEVAPAPLAPELAVARRLSLALTGAIPSLEEIRMFQARADNDRLAWWTAGLLKDRRSSDYLAERFARAYVGVANGPFLIYRRRRFVSWLADQLNENRPYDQIVRDLIASDGLWTSQPATNFITATIVQGEGKGPDETALAGRVSRAFLGLRIDCAECHDHPFDVWTEDDFHGLAAFFGKTEQSFTGIREGKQPYEREDRETGETRVIEPAVPFAQALLPEGKNRRRRLAAWVTHVDNKAFARATVNRVWALLYGRPLVEPVDNIPSQEASQGDVPPALDILADDFASHGYDLRRLIKLMAASEVFRLDSLEADGLTDQQFQDAQALGAIFPVTRLRPEQVVGALLQAGSIQTIDYQSHIFVRIARATGQSNFVKRYGDAGEDELAAHGGTIPQRLLLLNGNLVKEKTKPDLLSNAATQIAMIAPDDHQAVEAVFLAVLTRYPTPEEASHFQAKLRGSKQKERQRLLEDMYVALLNSTEFSWNH